MRLRRCSSLFEGKVALGSHPKQDRANDPHYNAGLIAERKYHWIIV